VALSIFKAAFSLRLTMVQLSSACLLAMLCLGSLFVGLHAEPAVEAKPAFAPTIAFNHSRYPQPQKQQNQAYTNSSGKMVGGYFVEWGTYDGNFHVADIPAQNLTHLFYAFIPVCGPNQSLQQADPQSYSKLVAQCVGKPDFTVVVHDKFAALERSYPGDTVDQPVRGIFAELYRLKKAHPDLKILPSVGGWTLSDPLYSIGVNAQARATFVASVIDMIKTYDFFDGVDIDWEFPGGGGSNPKLGSENDGAGFALLMRDLRLAMDTLSVETGRTYQLTAAMGGSVQKLQGIDWETAYPYMDYINLMTYDYYGEWDSVPGHHTTLYANPNSRRVGSSADEAVQHLLSRKVPSGKISLGVAMYGRSWSNISKHKDNNPFTGSGGNSLTDSLAENIGDYKKIETQYLGGVNGSGAHGFSLLWDDRAKACSLWNSAVGTLISFDCSRAVQAKGNYVLQYKLGGVFAWELDGDNGHLLNAMHEGLGHTAQ
jgi:chitinase